MAAKSSDEPVVLTDLSETDVARLGVALADRLRDGDALLLHGDIGAGKTHLARAVIQEILLRAGLSEDVPSPTFTLVQEYHAPGRAVLHADLYRVSHPDEIAELGLTDAFGRKLCLIEWPQSLGNSLPPDRVDAHIALGRSDDRRDISLNGTTPRLRQIVASIAAKTGQSG